jgi:hypothetical protein
MIQGTQLFNLNEYSNRLLATTISWIPASAGMKYSIMDTHFCGRIGNARRK